MYLINFKVGWLVVLAYCYVHGELSDLVQIREISKKYSFYIRTRLLHYKPAYRCAEALTPFRNSRFMHYLETVFKTFAEIVGPVVQN